ncbi:hypothetical protein TWF281_007576 [Arthrobotrys megalospora]
MAVTGSSSPPISISFSEDHFELPLGLQHCLDELSNIIYGSNSPETVLPQPQSAGEAAPRPEVASENISTDFDMAPMDRFLTSTQRSENPNVCYNLSQAFDFHSHAGSLPENPELSHTSDLLTRTSTIQSKRSSRTLGSTAVTNYD